MVNYKRKLQLKILEIIKDVDKICKENDIEYYLVYGSCLGAIRHKGFIPWDDDLDIAMTDENYKKFINVCENKLDKSKYFLQNQETEKNYYLSFSKIRNIKTTLIEKENKNIDITYGVYIDIFPLVGVPNNKIKRKILEINRAFMLSSNINIINNKVLSCIFKILLKLIGKDKILKYSTKQCFKYKCKDNSEWCSICDGGGFKINTFNKSVFGKPKYVKFEDTKLPIPSKPDEYLAQIYGDYMTFPSEEEKKKNEHTPYLIDFDMSYEEYKKKREEKYE